MSNLLKSALKRILPSCVVARYRAYQEARYIYHTLSYAQSGEDLILMGMVGGASGFYVDVGAHHSKRFSNTYLFYQRGWSGINIDATPGSMKSFRRDRPRDINIEAAVGSNRSPVRFHIFSEPALNTHSRELAMEYIRDGYRVIEEIMVPQRPLAEILDGHVSPGQQIDFMSIDTEGWDLDILKTNDWEKYAPTVVAVEDVGFNAESPGTSAICAFLRARGYKLVAFLHNKTLFFRREKVAPVA